MRITTLLLLLVAHLALAQDAPPSARDSAKRQLALRAAAQKIVDTLQTSATLSDDEARLLVAAMGARMQADVKAHADPQASQALCRKILSDERGQAIDRWIDDAISRAREHTALPIERADVLLQIGSDWNERVATEAKGYVEAHIVSLFGQARKQSVALQRDEMENRVTMPAETDLNTKLSALAEDSGHHPPTLADLDSLAEWLTSFATNASQPLFQEVQHSIRQAADQISARVKQQYQYQLTALRRAATTLPPSAIDADSIRSALMEATRTAVKALQVEEMRSRPDARGTIYGPLAVIESEAGRTAETLQEDRIATAIGAQADLPLDATTIASALRADLKAHQEPKESRRLLIGRYVAELRPVLTKRLAALAERADDEAFRARLDLLIVQTERLSLAVQERVGHSLDPLLAAARRTVARDQVTAVFGADPVLITALSPEAVQALWSASRCEAAKSFDDAWVSLAVTGLLQDSGRKDLLEEARLDILAAANRLIPPACRAMHEQANRLTALEQEWTEKLRKDVDSGRSLEKITTEWTRELDRRWRAYAEQEGLPYADLFARTLDLLDKTVRKLFDTREAELAKAAEAAAAAEQEPTQPQPEEEKVVEEPPPPPEETPEESTSMAIEELLETLDFVLYFRDAGEGRSEALLLDGDGSPTRLLFDPGNVRAAVEQVYQAILPAVEAAARGKAKANPERKGIMALFQKQRSLDMKVAVLVGSEEVRHMMSILLRNRVELFVADWNANPSNATLNLEWEDNLEIAQ